MLKIKHIFFGFIRERNVYIQFSSHQELTTMDQNTQGRNQVGDQILNILLFMWLLDQQYLSLNALAIV